MRLSTNFTLAEFTKSQTAIRQGLDNTPGEEHLANAKELFENVVQKVRENFGVTVINSGYRGPALNTAVGGSSNSQHCKGEAVDIECPGTANETVAQWIADNLEFDQLILEFAEKGIPDAGWVHVSYVSEGNRKQILTALRDPATRKTVYLAGLGHVQSMINYVYKTTNLNNNKFYVGVKTNSNHHDDGYFGSGLILNKAIKKYGINSFKKEILWCYGTPVECFKKEAEIVTENFIKRKDTYNIALGGKGGNLGDLCNKKKSIKLKGHKLSEQTKLKIGLKNKGNKVRLGSTHSEQTKKLISKIRKTLGIAKGQRNPMFGKQHTTETKIKMRKPHKSTGPKYRLSCLTCKKETTVNAFWRHNNTFHTSQRAIVSNH